VQVSDGDSELLNSCRRIGVLQSKHLSCSCSPLNSVIELRPHLLGPIVALAITWLGGRSIGRLLARKILNAAAERYDGLGAKW
jgi:hypothetical protein